MSYYIIYPLFFAIGLLPYRAKRWISQLIYNILYYVIKYRRGVVRTNLTNAFPQKNIAEIIEIEKKNYHHLADIFVDTMSMTTISKKQMLHRVEYINADQIEEYTKGRSWISAMAHYGSWELTTNWGLYSKENDVLAVYRPIHNKGVNKYFLQTRKRFGVKPVPMELVGKKVIEAKNAGRNITLAMIADQTPPYFSPIETWFDFMGRKTPFFTGMEKIAVKYKMPIAFMHVDKFEKQCYKIWFEIIYDGEEEIQSGEITQRYITRLQGMIEKRPELWMWSHNRWKHNYENIAK